jgi:chromate transport protein ChrA
MLDFAARLCRRVSLLSALAGPLAAELAIYIAWLKAGRLRALLVSIAFISPLFLMAVAIAAA